MSNESHERNSNETPAPGVVEKCIEGLNNIKDISTGTTGKLSAVLGLLALGVFMTSIGAPKG